MEGSKNKGGPDGGQKKEGRAGWRAVDIRAGRIEGSRH
jgi:hypothetical protein